MVVPCPLSAWREKVGSGLRVKSDQARWIGWPRGLESDQTIATTGADLCDHERETRCAGQRVAPVEVGMWRWAVVDAIRCRKAGNDIGRFTTLERATPICASL